MDQVAERPTIDELVAALLRDSGGLDFDPPHARLFIQTLRLLAQGKPVSREQAAQIAVAQGLSAEEADETLKWLSERDDDGQIVGLAGLSLNDWNHKFKVGSRALTTWCALDTLYLPHLLKQTVEVESLDPVTQAPIQVRVGPDQVVQSTPQSAVISIVVPKIADKGIESAEEIWMAFCNYSLYFTSTDTAQEWFADKHVAPYFLTIKEGRELGGKWFADVRQYA